MEATTSDTYGLSLSDYCEAHDLSPSDVWNKIRHGELVSRTIEGRLRIFGQESVSLPSPRLFGATVKDRAQASSELPDLPRLDDDFDIDTERRVQVPTVAIMEAVQPTSELALLIDHLSLAKEENKEILRMTQSSIRKISEMSEQLLESKEQIIDAHKQTIQEKKLLIEIQEEKIESLRQELSLLRSGHEQENGREKYEQDLDALKTMYEKLLAEKDARIDALENDVRRLGQDLRILRQEYEDLDILARTLANQKK